MSTQVTIGVLLGLCVGAVLCVLFLELLGQWLTAIMKFFTSFWR